MMNYDKYGIFDVYVDEEYLCRFRCSYGDILDLTWSIHHDNPTVSIEVRQVGPVDRFFDDGE